MIQVSSQTTERRECEGGSAHTMATHLHQYMQRVVYTCHWCALIVLKSLGIMRYYVFEIGCILMSINVHSELRDINFHNITPSWSPREGMFIVHISLFIVTFLSFVSRILSLMQVTKELNPYRWICATCKYVECHLLLLLLPMPLVECWRMHMPRRPGRSIGVKHTNGGERKVNAKFHSVTCYTNSIIASYIHVNTTKLCNSTCTLVATCVILRSS